MRRHHLLNPRTGLPVCGKRGTHTLIRAHVTCQRCKRIAHIDPLPLIELMTSWTEQNSREAL